MSQFQPHINTDYPPNNKIIFEEWFAAIYKGCSTDRELIPVNFTSYFVNTGYNTQPEPREALQAFIDSLDRSKKWFCICQYDDGVIIDFKDLDVLEFNMSKNIGVPLPLICQPHPYKFSGGKQLFANFIGNKTHPIRETARQLQNLPGYYVSYAPHPIEAFCKIIHDSIFTLCYRGYGANSFRITEAMQYGSIPVYISDEFIYPFGLDFGAIGVIIPERDASRIDEILSSIPPATIIQKQDQLAYFYQNYYTYEGCLTQIQKELEAEYYRRKP